MTKKPGPSTRSVHGGRRVDPATRSILTPIYSNSAYAYDDIETWRAVALKQKPGHIYSRNTNPTTDMFESRIAGLEGAESAISFATGMAAISTTLLALLRAGDRAVSVKDAYGATYLHFTDILPQYGIACDVCETGDMPAIEAAVARGCRLVYLETPTNPTLKVLDIARLAAAAHKTGAVVVVDNTFATPINQNPLALGADLVVHSATKYICGHGDVLGGVLCGPVRLVEQVFRHRELTGASMDAFSAAQLLRSLKTLGLRVTRQNENALAIARFLEGHQKVAHVYYPGLEKDPGHAVARRQMSGFGGVLSFDLKGGFDAVCAFLPRLKYAYLAANLGQVETIAGPPSTTSHVELTDEARRRAGINEGLIRYAVGIEDVDDLIEDIGRALESL